MANKLVKHVLKNGLQIYFYKDETKHTFFAELITKFGGLYSNFEVNGKKYHIDNGVAHFIEHLLIETSPYGNLMHVLGEMGMSPNGSTYPERTTFFFDGVERLEEGLTVLLNGINKAIFTREDIEKVKGPILSEIRMGRDSKPRRLTQASNENVFCSIPYQSGIGTLSYIESLEYDTVKACYDAFYRPDNEVLVVAGNFNEGKILSLIEKAYASKYPEDVVYVPPYQEEDEVHKKHETIYMPTGQSVSKIVFKLDVSKFTSREKLDLDFYLSYFEDMNFGVVSPLYKKLVEEHVIIDGISSGHTYLDHFFLFSVTAYTEQTEIFIHSVLEQIMNPIFDEELFELSKRESKAFMCVRPERIRSVVAGFVENMFLYNFPVLDTVEDIERLSYETFKANISKLNFEHYTTIALENKETA